MAAVAAVLAATALNAAGAPRQPSNTHPGARRPEPIASDAGAQAVRESASVSPTRLAERAALLKQGEAHLVKGDAKSALMAFDRAAMILHAADTENSLVRSYMQAGEYRRALAFAAHTAGAHLDATGGAALYAWLLYAGGQPEVAQRLLSTALESATDQSGIKTNAMLVAVQQQLRSGTPLATGDLLKPPARLAPYSDAQRLLEATKIKGSAVLLPGGTFALMPLAWLPASGNLWLRNGLGQLSKATTAQRFSSQGVAKVKLSTPLPFPPAQRIANLDAFAGSAGFAVDYVAAGSNPAWPVLHTGFLGRFIANGPDRQLGIDMPAGARGGPVFDAAGQLTGIALTAANHTADRLVSITALRSAGLKLVNSAPAEQSSASSLNTPSSSSSSSAVKRPPAQPAARAAVDQIYEDSLKIALQVMTEK